MHSRMLRFVILWGSGGGYPNVIIWLIDGSAWIIRRALVLTIVPTRFFAAAAAGAAFEQCVSWLCAGGAPVDGGKADVEP